MKISLELLKKYQDLSSESTALKSSIKNVLMVLVEREKQIQLKNYELWDLVEKELNLNATEQYSVNLNTGELTPKAKDE